MPHARTLSRSAAAEPVDREHILLTNDKPSPIPTTAEIGHGVAMTLDEYNAFCKNLAHAVHVVQWGNAHVWKVGGEKTGSGGKLFAVAGWGEVGDFLAITFKTSPLTYDILKDQPGLRPAPYLASRGMKWIQHFDKPGLDAEALKEYLAESHRQASLNLTKKRQKELGLNQ